MEWMSFLLLYAYIHNDFQHENICLTFEEDSTQSQIEMGLFKWLVMTCQAAVNIDNDGSAQTHRSGRSEVGALSASFTGRLSAEKSSHRHHILPPCPTQTGGYFWADSATQDSCSLTDYGFEEDVNKGRGVSLSD